MIKEFFSFWWNRTYPSYCTWPTNIYGLQRDLL